MGKIHNIVVGPSKESNAWCIAVLLDPEDTGLRDLVLSTLTYARIADSDKEFIDYQVRLHVSLEALAEEFRRERQAIISGKSLETLIRSRKIELDKATRGSGEVLKALRAFLEGGADLASTLRKVEKSGIQGARLDWIVKMAGNTGEEEKQARMKEIRLELEKRGWLMIQKEARTATDNSGNLT